MQLDPPILCAKSRGAISQGYRQPIAISGAILPRDLGSIINKRVLFYEHFSTAQLAEPN